MFDTEILSTAMTEDSAAAYFGNKVWDSSATGSPEDSLLSTMRAIVTPRLNGNYLEIIRHTNASVVNSYNLEFSTTETMFKETMRNTVNTIFFQEINTAYNIRLNGDVTFDYLVGYFKTHWNEDGHWTLAPSAGNFFSKFFKCECYVNERMKTSIVFFERDNELRKYLKNHHLLQVGIPVFLPWYFKDNPLDDLEMSLMKSLQNGDRDEYILILSELADRMGFKEEYIRKTLEEASTYIDERSVASIKGTIATIDATIEDWYRQIENQMKSRRQQEILLAGTYERINNPENNMSEFTEYFMNSKSLEFISFSDGKIDYVVKTNFVLNNDDAKDEFERVIGNKYSVLYNNQNVFRKNDLEKLYKKIFLDEEIKLQLCAAYEMDFVSLTINPIRGFCYGDTIKCEYMPNPHIDRWNCIGDYRSRFANAMKNGEYIEALILSMASAGSISPYDSTVLSTFSDYITQYNASRCLVLPDCRIVTPVEAVVWIEEQETQKGEEKNE